MVSDLFMKDWRAMTAAGVAFTPADVVRLNALAVRVRLSRSPLGRAHARRVVFMDGWEMREPTLGHEMWIERVATYIDLRANRNFQIVYAFALSREWRELPDALKARKVVREVFAFARRRLLGLTDAQLADAVDYAVWGADWKAGEFAPPRAEKERGGEAEERRASPAVGVYLDAVSHRLPLSLDDARRMTASEILEAVNRAKVRDRAFDFDGAYNEAFAEYVRAREEVRARSSAGEGGRR